MNERPDSSFKKVFDAILDRGESILKCAPEPAEAGELIGASRDGREVRAFRYGAGPRRISLLAGCHADEPVGPRLLRRVSGYLAKLPPDDALLTDYQWWIVPHINPDGAARNSRWQTESAPAYDLAD
jgi:predicted deacylase